MADEMSHPKFEFNHESMVSQADLAMEGGSETNGDQGSAEKSDL